MGVGPCIVRSLLKADYGRWSVVWGSGLFAVDLQSCHPRPAPRSGSCDHNRTCRHTSHSRSTPLHMMHSRLADMGPVSAELSPHAVETISVSHGKKIANIRQLQVMADMSVTRNMDGQTCAVLSAACCVLFEGKIWALVHGVRPVAICGRPPVMASRTNSLKWGFRVQHDMSA